MAVKHSRATVVDGAGQVQKRTVGWETLVYGQTGTQHSDKIT